MTQIETPRLLLRQWRTCDFDAFAAMNADPDVMRYFPEPYSKRRSEQFYKSIQAQFARFGYGLYAVEQRCDGSFLGFIGFHWASFDADFCPCIEISWRLRKEYWNRGFATEGARACLEHGWTRLGFDRVHSFTAVINLPSQRVMQKIGMFPLRCFAHPDLPDRHPLRSHICCAADRSRGGAHNRDSKNPASWAGFFGGYFTM